MHHVSQLEQQRSLLRLSGGNMKIALQAAYRSSKNTMKKKAYQKKAFLQKNEVLEAHFVHFIFSILLLNKHSTV